MVGAHSTSPGRLSRLWQRRPKRKKSKPLGFPKLPDNGTAWFGKVDVPDYS